MDTQDTIGFNTSTPRKPNDDEDEINVKRDETESLKESLHECKELLDLANAKIASLEEDGIKKSNEVEKYVRITTNMRAKNSVGDNSKLKKEVTEYKKQIKKLNERLAENMKKLREETNRRANAEAEGKVKDSTIEALKEVLARQQSGSQQAGVSRPPSPRGGGAGQGQAERPEPCRDFLKNGFCHRNQHCRFFHPPGRIQPGPQPDSSQKPDCKFWLEGWCRKEENICWGKHAQGKRGSQTKQPVQAGSNLDFNNPDFVQALTKVVSQTLAGGAPGQPARGQQQPFTQPQQQTIRQQNIMTNQNQPIQSMQMNNQPMLMNNQQPMMMPMMMLPVS